MATQATVQLQPTTKSQTTTRVQYWAGGLLMLSSLVAFALPPDFPGKALVASLVFATALLLLAFGGGVENNIYRGDRVGTIALALLAFWTIANGVVSQFALLPELPADVLIFVALGLALATAVQLGRSQHLPARWRWSPAWTLAVYVVVWVFGPYVVALVSTQETAVFAMAISGLVAAAIPVFLGVLVVLHSATRHLAETE